MINAEVPPGFGRGGRLRQTLAPVEWMASRATSALRLAPDFLIIGAQKGGTTSLCSYLFSHPQILPARRKEIHYFDAEQFAHGDGWYRAHFETVFKARQRAAVLGRRVITGEASPYYLTHPHTPQRVAATLPAAKLIVMLRNPIDRALSHYNHQVRMDRETLTFAQALDAEDERLKGELDRMLADDSYYSHSYWAYSYLARSRYAEQLQRWLSCFPREQLLTISSERFFSEPHLEFQKVLRFLELDEFELESYRKQNTGEYKGMDPALRSRLDDYFRPYNEQLYDLLGCRFDW